MKGVDVVMWSGEPLRHLKRHGGMYTFCSAMPSVDCRSFPHYKAKEDAPTCLRCVGRAMCGSKI